jgi:hypothetical protein
VGFFSGRKRLSVTENGVCCLVFHFSVYHYFCNFNYRLFFVVNFLVFFFGEGSLCVSVLVSITDRRGTESDNSRSLQYVVYHRRSRLELNYM